MARRESASGARRKSTTPTVTRVVHPRPGLTGDVIASPYVPSALSPLHTHPSYGPAVRPPPQLTSASSAVLPTPSTPLPRALRPLRGRPPLRGLTAAGCLEKSPPGDQTEEVRLSLLPNTPIASLNLPLTEEEVITHQESPGVFGVLLGAANPGVLAAAGSRAWTTSTCGHAATSVLPPLVCSGGLVHKGAPFRRCERSCGGVLIRSNRMVVERHAATEYPLRTERK
jgi:hypothetical protein